MYSTEKNPGYNWKDLLLKLIFVIIFILLLIWLFKINTPNMKPFYSNVFRENIKYMQDAAESYYTNERLPKNIGDTSEITLAEMIEKSLVLPFVDEDGNECNTKESYVSVTKNEKDYTLKTTLVCPKEKNSVVKVLGCYDYCEDCKEEEKKEEVVTEYQFKKEVSNTVNSYSCPNGGTLSNGKCYIYENTSYKATEKTTNGEYYCSNGGTLKDGKCYTTKTTSYTALSNTSGGYYTCPNGGTLSGSKCYVSSSYYSDIKADIDYLCPVGYIRTGNQCARFIDNSYSYNATKVTTNDSTYTYNATKTTGKSTTTTYAATWTKIYLGYTPTSKPSGYTCSTATQNICTSSSNCPGYTTVYTGCYKSGYKCNSGDTLSGSTCTKTVAGTTTYTCPNGGTLSGTKCTVTKSGTTSYTCPKGGTLSGTKCYVSGETTSELISATASYSCPSGYTKSGSYCTKLVSDTSNYNATWINSTTTKYCRNTSDKLSGNLCYATTTDSYSASKTNGNTSYSCPSGGSLNTSTKTCSQTKLKTTYDATKTTKVNKGYTYKWSTSETLDGWTRTGATRTSTK